MSADTPEQTVQQEQQIPGATTPGAASPGAAPAPGGSSPTEQQAAADAPTQAPTAVAGEGSPSGDDVTEIEGDLDALVTVAAERDEYLALAQRTQADFENYRRRVAREAVLAQERGVAKLAKELLPALDSLDRALAGAAVDDPLLQGVRLVRAELIDALGRLGIESFSPAGEPFDPSVHEAVAQQAIEGIASGLVAEVYQPGYRLGEHIIRPARVVVAA